MVSVFRISLRGIGLCLSCTILFSGCVMQRAHYKSFGKLRDEAASNYTQQVLDTIVDVMDEGDIPVFFSIEAGQSGWQPSFSGSVTSSLRGPWNNDWADAIGISPTISKSESMSDSIQYNDFGAAAMIRVCALYGLLCLPQEVAGVKLPNGVLYAIADISDSNDGFIAWSKMKDGRYLGITEEKKSDFIAFSRDVTYWSRGYTPDPKDLLSVPGIFYRCSAEYAAAQLSLAQAVATKMGAQAGVAEAQKAYEQKLQEFEALKEEAKKSKSDPEIMKTLLQFEREEVQAKAQAVAGVAAAIGQADSTIKASRRKINSLMPLIAGTFKKIQDSDPDVGPIDIEGVLVSINDYVEKIEAGDQKVLAEIANVLPHSAGLDAKDSVDDLYRERFEALPQRFDSAFQAQ